MYTCTCTFTCKIVNDVVDWLCATVLEIGSANYRDLDSDVARQLDAQYKQILKKKSGKLKHDCVLCVYMYIVEMFFQRVLFCCI